jgi:hypothetical protein
MRLLATACFTAWSTVSTPAWSSAMDGRAKSTPATSATTILNDNPGITLALVTQN